VGLVCWAVDSQAHTFGHEDVLGTTLQLQVDSPSLHIDRKAEARVLDEIARLSQILSTYSDSSEISAFLRGPQTPRKASPELVEVLRACDYWTTVSAGAFNPAAELFSRAWSRSAEQNRAPSQSELAEALRLARLQAWQIDAARQTITRRADLPLSLNAIAKGYVIDRACRAGLHQTPGVTGILLDIGGDLRVSGDTAKIIGIADPWSSADNAPPLCCIEVRNAAVATSGNYEQGFEVNGAHYSHIIDPRTGQPVDHVVSATVVAPHAAQADVLATILNVLEPGDGIGLVERLEDTECLVIGRDRQMQKSSGWDRLVLPDGELLAQAESGPPDPGAIVPGSGERSTESGSRLARLPEQAEAPAEAPPPPEPAEPVIWGHDLEFVVDLQLKSGGWYRYARPYVAVWIEDAKGRPVRTLALWGRDYRWLPYLRRWYYLHRNDRRLIYAVSRATRPPGRYRIVWDGRANDGKYLPTGQYIVNIEASREHGTYQIIRQMVEIGGEPFAFETQGNTEVPRASVEYRRKTASEEKRKESGS
jgi:thiamine biosynthesis lipoprotein ApbE